MITTKKFLDTRTGEIVERFNILDIKFMRELDDDEIQNNLFCEVCEKEKISTRFEGEIEKNICDSCLYDIKQQ